MLDSDPEGDEYHARLQHFKAAVTTKFENFYRHDDNPIVSLFQTLIKFEETILDLDYMGLESLANELHELHDKADANLRAVISRMLDTDIYRDDVPFDEEFVSRVSNPVVWIEDYRTRHRNSQIR